MKAQGLPLKRIAIDLGYQSVNGVHVLFKRHITKLRVELIVNDEVICHWLKKDIREDYTEHGQLLYKERIKLMIEKLEAEIKATKRLAEICKYNEYSFAIVYRPIEI